MILLFVILAFIAIYGMRFSPYNEDYISLESTNAIKGVFAVIILLSHMRGYMSLPSNIVNNSYINILKILGQLMVAPYLFFSGYGILESLKKKPNYLQTFPKKRIFKTLIHFDIAVFAYLIASVITGTHFPIHSYVTCWIGLGSLGNSNWFVFDILALYVITYVAMQIATFVFKRDKDKQRSIAILTSVFSVVLWIALHQAGKESWWYDTLISFPVGMWFSYFRDDFEFFMRQRLMSIVAVLSLCALFVGWRISIGNDQYGICACIFCMLITALLTKVHIGNSVLQWLGSHAFAIYIMQRLPMNLFEHFGLNSYPYLFALISIPSALVIAWCFNKVISVVDTKFSL